MEESREAPPTAPSNPASTQHLSRREHCVIAKEEEEEEEECQQEFPKDAWISPPLSLAGQDGGLTNQVGRPTSAELREANGVRNPSPAHQEPSPAHQQPSPAHQQPSPAHQEASPAHQEPCGIQNAPPHGVSGPAVWAPPTTGSSGEAGVLLPEEEEEEVLMKNKVHTLACMYGSRTLKVPQQQNVRRTGLEEQRRASRSLLLPTPAPPQARWGGGGAMKELPKMDEQRQKRAGSWARGPEELGAPCSPRDFISALSSMSDSPASSLARADLPAPGPQASDPGSTPTALRSHQDGANLVRGPPDARRLAPQRAQQEDLTRSSRKDQEVSPSPCRPSPSPCRPSPSPAGGRSSDRRGGASFSAFSRSLAASCISQSIAKRNAPPLLPHGPAHLHSPSPHGPASSSLGHTPYSPSTTLLRPASVGQSDSSIHHNINNNNNGVSTKAVAVSSRHANSANSSASRPASRRKPTLAPAASAAMQLLAASNRAARPFWAPPPRDSSSRLPPPPRDSSSLLPPPHPDSSSSDSSPPGPGGVGSLEGEEGRSQLFCTSVVRPFPGPVPGPSHGPAPGPAPGPRACYAATVNLQVAQSGTITFCSSARLSLNQNQNPLQVPQQRPTLQLIEPATFLWRRLL